MSKNNSYTNWFIIQIAAFLLLFLIAAGPLFGISAVVQSTAGKVELKSPGGGWQTARQGMNIDGGTTISTGFNSKALINIGESVLEVKALTRMELEELVEREGVLDTKLHLKVGKVKADVRSTEGLRNNFRLRSPISTAAVRGTVFEYDGYSLWVEEGTVVLGNNIGQGRPIFQGEEGGTDGYSQPTGGDETITQQFEVESSTSGGGGIVQVGQTVSDYALVVLNLQWD
jgi:hypothetical protein